jgi:hypothetical protein
MRIGRQEQAVALGAGTTAGPAQSLQKRSHFGGGVNLDDSVEIPHIDSQFQGAGGDDDTIAGILECLFGSEAFVTAKGTVRDKRLDTLAAKECSQFFGLRTAIGERQALFAAMKMGDHVGSIRHVADIVDHDFGIGRRLRWRDDYLGGAPGISAEPAEQTVGLSHSGGKTDALGVDTGDSSDPVEDMEQVPAAVISSEGVQLVGDDELDSGK